MSDDCPIREVLERLQQLELLLGDRFGVGSGMPADLCHDGVAAASCKKVRHDRLIYLLPPVSKMPAKVVTPWLCHAADWARGR